MELWEADHFCILLISQKKTTMTGGSASVYTDQFSRLLVGYLSVAIIRLKLSPCIGLWRRLSVNKG